jgi:isopentenyldiphosphate isomerase
MSEIITTYKLDDLDQPISMDRDEFYDGQIELFKKTGKNTHAAAIVDVFLFTPDRQIILQKRSNQKKHNPSLTDKAIGGHIKWGDTANYTVTVETLEELNVSSIVLDSEEDFKKTYKLLKNHLHNSAIVQFIDSRTTNFSKLFDEGFVDISKKYYFYMGVYNGSIRPVDKEAEGIMFIEYDKLEQKMRENPEMYSEDLKFYLKKYNKKITEFLSYLA